MSRADDYRRGFRDGLEAYAWEQGGERYVGKEAVPLRKAQAGVERTWNYGPPEDDDPALSDQGAIVAAIQTLRRRGFTWADGEWRTPLPAGHDRMLDPSPPPAAKPDEPQCGYEACDCRLVCKLDASRPAPRPTAQEPVAEVKPGTNGWKRLQWLSDEAMHRTPVGAALFIRKET